MGTEELTTEFASPERSQADEVTRQHNLFAESPQFKTFAGYVPDPVLVLNNSRQIVFANRAAVKVVESINPGNPAGLRPGEALRCQHALTAACGCGTSAFCRYCGAVKAILSSLKGVEDVQECLITQDGGETLLFMCYTYPIPMGVDTFSLFILKDITKERRVQILERVFFHDIKNLLTALNGWVDLLKDVNDPGQARDISRVLVQLSSEMVDEVNAQEQLVSAESNRLVTHAAAANSVSLLRDLEALYSQHEVAEGKSIVIDGDADSVEFRTDASLIKRVLGNMLRNALEATPPSGCVTMGCRSSDNKVVFSVHNPGFIPPEVQSQIFKWSFSTKGKGRGMGTYGMRILSERYLNGKVTFHSSPEEGTTFEAAYPLRAD